MPRPLDKVRSLYDTVMQLERNDWVRKFYGQSVLSPYMGIVTNTVPSLGLVDVQWPFGNKREEVQYLVKVNKTFTNEIPVVSDDTSYRSYDNP